MLGCLGLGSKGCARYGGEREKRHVSEIHNEHQRSSERCYTKCRTAAKIDGSAAAGATFPPLQPPGPSRPITCGLNDLFASDDDLYPCS